MSQGRWTSTYSLRRPWFTSVNRHTVRDDAIAGLTNAAIVLPQGVAFAVIAGLPPEYGLFTAMITPVIAAMWGSSMIMVSGPTTAISAVMFAAVSQLAPPGTPVYIQFALTLTIIAGIFQLVAGAFRLGGLISFISHSVMVGFTAAAALLIGASQLAGAFGITVESGGGVVERVIRVVENWDAFNPLALFIATATLISIIVVQKVNRRIPSYLVALIVGVIVGELSGGREAGVAMFESLPSVLPSFALPQVSLYEIAALLPASVSIAFVGLLEAISIGRSFAIRRRERYDSNQEIVGQGLSNVVAGFFQAYAGSGSFTRSALNVESGAKTPMSAMFAALFLVALLLVVAPFIDRIPKPAMAGIIIYVAWRLINFTEIRHILQTSQSETVILALTFLAGITTELENAIFVGVLASLVVFLNRSAHPHVAAISPIIHNGRRLMRGVKYHDLDQCPQISVLRLEGPLFFGSVEHVESWFRHYDTKYPGRKFKVLALKGMGKIDLAGVDFLAQEILNQREEGGDFHISIAFSETVRALDRMKLFDVLGKSNLHLSKAVAIGAVVEQVDPDICAGCTIRAYIECSGKPSPEGVNPEERAPVINEIERTIPQTKPPSTKQSGKKK